MLRKKQVVLNLMVIVALFVSSIGVLPAGAKVVADVPGQAAAAISPAQVGDKSATGQETRAGFKAAVDVKLAELQALEAVGAKYEAQGDQEVVIIVRLSDPDLVNYKGGVAGLAPTAAEVVGEGQFNANSAASQAYMSYLADKQAAFVSAVQQFSQSAVVVANYQAAMNGVALRLPASDVAKVSKMPEVAAIYESEILKVQTDRGPQWIDAPAVWAALGGQGVSGEGVVIGVIDTGIWSPNPLTPTLQYTMTHPSFASDASAYGGAYTFPFTSVTGLNFNQKLGVCAPVPTQSSDGTFVCNDKIIGAYWYNSNGIATATEFKSPLDNGGHGSHTASTAGGNRATATVSGAPVVSGVAPRARIIAYKVCWEEDPDVSDDGGCANVDSLSAVNQAILDGVNTINFSISGGENPTSDPVELAFLNARAAGIFVSASAGNSGPAASTVAHRGPWTNTSAAMMHDRTVLGDVVVTSTFGTPPVGLRGASATAGFTGKAVLAPKQDAGDTYPGRCIFPYASGTFQATDVVVCRRGVNARIEKSKNVQAGGAGGFILVNADDNQGLSLDAYWVPGVHLERNATALSPAGESLITYLLTAVPTNVVTITLSGGYPFTRTGDVMASFSSRGPSGLNQIKPDNAAPGVEILAGVTPQASENWTPDGHLYEYYNGTSMSSPHTAGAGALLKALHPDWTAAEIQAALMTGSVPILKEDGTTPATPLDQGAGRINLANSMMPGLLFDVPIANYQSYISGTKPIETLNIPSFAQMRCLTNCSWMRMAENAMTTTATYTWTAVMATPGFTVTLDQASYTFAAGETKNFTVMADVSALPENGQYVFARIILRETTTGQEVHMPVAVIKVGSSFDASVDISTPRDSGGQTFNGTLGNSYTGVATTLYGLADPMMTASFANGGDDRKPETDPLDPAHGWFLLTDTLPSGLGRYIVSTSNSTASDLDMYLLYDSDGDGYDFVDGDPNNPASDVIARSATNATNERIELLDLQARAGEDFLIAVYNWSGEVDANFDLTRWHVTNPASGLQVTGVPATLNAGDVITPLVTYNKAMLPGYTYYGLINIGDVADEATITQIPVSIRRTASEVVKSVSTALAQTGDVLTYTIVLKNQDAVARTFNLTDVLPAGVTYVPGSLTGPATYSPTLNAVLLNASISGPTFGTYNFKDSRGYNGGTAVLPFFSIAGQGYSFCSFFSSCDDANLNFSVPGGNFAYYGNVTTTLGINSNGYLKHGSLADADNTGIPQLLPDSAAPNNEVAGFWTDLDMDGTSASDPGAGNAWITYTASHPSFPGQPVVVVQWDKAEQYDNAVSASPMPTYTFEIVWVAGSDHVYYVYSDMRPLTDNFPEAAVGSENATGTAGTTYFFSDTTTLVGQFPSAVPTNTLTVEMYRPTITAPPITVTFQVTVANPPLVTVINAAQYTVDVPNTTLMSANASFNMAAQLAVAHLAPFANTIAGTSVTVTLDSTPVLTDFVYGESTGYLSVLAGPHLVEIYPGASATPAITANVVLSENLSYSAVAIGDGPNQPLSLLALLDDTVPVSGSVKIRIGHLAPFAAGGAAADVRLQDGTPIITNVLFSQVATYLTLPAGTYDLKITAPGGYPTLIDPLPVTLNSNDILSAFATGDGVKQKLGVFAWPSNTAGFFLPLGAQLAVAHLAPFANTLAGTSVTVTLDAAPVLTDFVYGESTGYLPVPEGAHLVEIFPAGSASPAITGTVNLVQAQSYSAVAIGDGTNQPLSLLALLDDTVPVSGSVKIRIGHLAPFAAGGAAADVRLQDGTPIITNVLFSQVAPYLTLPAGTYDLKITAPGGTPTLIDPAPVTFNSNDILSAFAAGDGVKQKLGVFAWPSNQPGFFLPLMKLIYLPLVNR